MIVFCNVPKQSVFFLTAALLVARVCCAQDFLNKTVSVTANRQTIAQVLTTVGNQGGFYFSYSSTIIPGDSVVSVAYRSVTVRQVLDKLLGDGYQYKETGKYLIIQRKEPDKYLIVSGYITDLDTGEPADFASVYSKTKLVSDLTNDKGHFRLKFKDGSFPIAISVGKVGYADTTVIVSSSSEVNIALSPKAVELDPVWVMYSEAERTWLARLFVSDKLRLQSRNIGRFFTSLPYQASLTPGLSTHGAMNSQIENKVSINLIGGYSGGVNGVEVAGFFNITKRSVRYCQVAGWFNVVSSSVTGAQVAGLYNHVLDSLQGAQVSAVANLLMENMHGAQVTAGLNIAGGNIDGAQVAAGANVAKGWGRGGQISAAFNHIDSTMYGAQVTAGVNHTSETIHGAQIACLLNVSRKTEGLQFAFFNYTKKLKGLQFGLVNYADSSSGASIGLINILKHGTSDITVYANEITAMNVAWKMGNKHLYTMLLAGAGINGENSYTLGFGVGKEFKIGKSFGVQTEILSQSIMQKSWENPAGLVRTQFSLAYWFTDRFALFAGPALSIYYNGKDNIPPGNSSFPPGFIKVSLEGEKASGWIGVQAGLSWRYGRK